MLEWVDRRSRRLLGSSVGRGFRDLTIDVPVADRHALAVVFPPGGLLWAHRAALRQEISGFLSG